MNARVERVRRIFKWAVAEELVPPAVYQALAAVSGLQRGRTTAHETAPVEPVEDSLVDATILHLNRHVRGLVQFQRLTGCRPREACQVRRCDIDADGPVWFYTPARHKTAWKGKSRVIAVGPKAQELLAGCPCDSGCPSCVGPVGEIGENGKQSAVRILTELQGVRE